MATMATSAAIDLAVRGTLAFRPLSAVAGVEITGIDLAEPLAPENREAILAAFLAHHVLVFRGQHLSTERQAAFTLQFGELEDHVIRLGDGKPPPLVHVVSNLDEHGKPTAKPYSSGNYFWHTDKSYHAIPSYATLLHAVDLPPEGGDTQFANTAMAYAALPEETKQRLAGLRVVHSWEASRLNTGNRPATEDEKRDRPPVNHPLVRTHPESGEKVLYIGTHTSHIEGMDRTEGRALLAELLAHASQPQFIYTHQWREGDLVMWDNRCLLHRAVANYEMAKHKRVLHRTVIRGTAPPV
ncbi:MAG: TauD/TfdA family dioxygenase [Alphaproteobacteria bacterium]|nr:TauD/TfdA family dioxygenase [Alphaproteobacteria bacterium]